MTKLSVAVLFLISDLLCLIAFIMSIKSKSRFRVAIANVTGAGSFTTTAYTLTLLFNTYRPMQVAYGIYFFSIDWLCTALFFFMLTYSYRVRCEVLKKTLLVTIPIVFIDSVSQLVNIWTSHSVTFKMDYLENGDLLFSLVSKVPFQIHLGICYLLVGAGLICLLIRMATASRIYRSKYLSIIGLLILIVAFNGLFVIGRFEIDFSIIGYSLCAILVSFYTIILMPRQLANHMSGSLVTHLNSVVFIFDDFGYLVFKNRLAQEYPIKNTSTLNDIFCALKIQQENWDKEYRQDVEYQVDGHRYILDLRFQTMRERTISESHKNIGSYLIMDDVTEQRIELKNREYKTTHDEVTGLYNREYFIQMASELVKRDDGVCYAVAMTNISQFKLYNEVFGKKAGDKLLLEIADQFRKAVEIENIAYGRYEADRFVACLPIEYCTEEFVKKTGIDEPVHLDSFLITNYIGICKVEYGEQEIEQVCDRAAIALNTIKGDAELRVAFYDSCMKDSLLRERELTASFPKALANHEIQIYIQPQVNQINGNIIGGEVLARWIMEDKTMISPGEFVPVLEKNGLITELDLAVWDKACQVIQEYHLQGKKISLSVNISTQDFYRVDLYEVFTGLLKQYGIPATSLKLEITESNFLNNMEEQLQLIYRLQAVGFIIEMDDFGSGYSSLNSLKDIPVDVLKMDLKFMENIKDRKRGQIIIHHVIRMAEELDVAIITEGVETKEQTDILKDMGCSYIQGYYFGKPMPVQGFMEFCESREFEEMVVANRA